MELQYDTFEQSQIEKNGVGAGIIPFSTNPSGDVHLLLGRERYMHRFRGSCRWSGFEGSRKHEETLMDTAVREFAEESMCTVMSREAMHELLMRRQHHMRVVLKVNHHKDSAERYHATYLVRVPWDDSVSHRFQALRLSVENIDRALREWRLCRPRLFENAVVGPIIEGDDGSVEVDAVFATTPANTKWRLVAGTRHFRLLTTGHDAHRMSQWRVLRERVERSLVVHPCVHPERDTLWSILQDVRIETDHMEKDQVRWWSLADLQRVMKNHGHLHFERFRPYFLPVLQTLIEQLTYTSPLLRG